MSLFIGVILGGIGIGALALNLSKPKRDTFEEYLKSWLEGQIKGYANDGKAKKSGGIFQRLADATLDVQSRLTAKLYARVMRKAVIYDETPFYTIARIAVSENDQLVFIGACNNWICLNTVSLESDIQAASEN